MKVLFIGDVVGENGQDLLAKALPQLKNQHKPDVTIVNGENSHKSGTGITEKDARFLFGCGADVITGGNHSLRRCGVDFYEENEFVLCPANFNVVNDESCGVCVLDMGRNQICVVSLIGTVFLDANRSPFFEMDKIIKKYGDMPIFVDFHAEATSEKNAFGYYFNGKIQCIFGTHTHVATADERLLDRGSGYITDVGMCGVRESVIGADIETALIKFADRTFTKKKQPAGEMMINGVVFTVDENTNYCTNIKRITY